MCRNYCIDSADSSERHKLETSSIFVSMWIPKTINNVDRHGFIIATVTSTLAFWSPTIVTILDLVVLVTVLVNL